MSGRVTPTDAEATVMKLGRSVLIAAGAALIVAGKPGQTHRGRTDFQKSNGD